MATALALQPQQAHETDETIAATVQQLDALANVISEIDSYKHFDPHRLPNFIKQGKHAVTIIRANLLYPIGNAELEVKTEQLDAFSHCLKCIEEIVISQQFDLLMPMIEVGHDLVTLMAGDKVDLIYPKD